MALIHAYIVWLEMFAWLARGPKVFNLLPPELFPATESQATVSQWRGKTLYALQLKLQLLPAAGAGAQPGAHGLIVVA